MFGVSWDFVDDFSNFSKPLRLTKRASCWKVRPCEIFLWRLRRFEEVAEEKVIECEFHAARANFILRGEEAPSSFGYEGVARGEPERCMIDIVEWGGSSLADMATFQRDSCSLAGG